MSAMQTVAQSLRILGITAERIAASVADRVEDASVRIIVRRAVVDELSWLDRLIAEAKTPPRLTDAEREALEWAIEIADSLAECSGAGTGGEPSREATTLRGLLARRG